MAAMLTPLDKIDPAEAWEAWTPSASDPWDRKWAAHLYRRAAFGASREELAEAEKLGLEGTLELLLNGRSRDAEVLETLTDVGRVAASRDDAGSQLRGWWLYCMLQGGHPLREKLTLFWHNHFATSIVKVRDSNLMFRQNCLLREHALGKFGPMLQAISRDAAMLVWLDSNSNVKGKPNENYAREVMELFSLGVGNYTEKDVREAARAFTGWHTDGAGFRFKAARTTPAEDGARPDRQLGRRRRGAHRARAAGRGALPGPQAVRGFVSETAPPDALLEPLCDSFRKSDYDIAALVRTMLSSRHLLLGPRLPQADQEPGRVRPRGGAGRLSTVRRGRRGLSAAAAASAGRPADGDGPGAVRAAERQGLAGRPRLAEHLDRAGARQLRRGAGVGKPVEQSVRESGCFRVPAGGRERRSKARARWR